MQLCNKIWKSNSVVTLVNRSLWNLAREFEILDFGMSVWSMKPRDWFFVETESAKWKDKKRMIIDAMSTLYFLNDQKEMDTELFNVLLMVPEKLGFDPDKSDESLNNLQTVEIAQSMCQNFLKWPLADLRAILEELKLISEIYLSIQNETEVKNILTRLML
jgi:hypothetical protein